MIRIGLAICAAAGVLALGACADDEYYHQGGGGYAYNDRPDVWYDGYYGDYVGGYWGPDTAFYYQDRDGRFLRDDGLHFRRDRFEGARGMRAGRPPNLP